MMKIAWTLALFSCFALPAAAQIAEIIDSTGDGTNTLLQTRRVAVDLAGNVYATGEGSDNVFKIATTGEITEFIDSTGDGAGNALNDPIGIALDGSDNVFVVGSASHNVFRVPAELTPAELLSLSAE